MNKEEKGCLALCIAVLLILISIGLLVTSAIVRVNSSPGDLSGHYILIGVFTFLAFGATILHVFVKIDKEDEQEDG